MISNFEIIGLVAAVITTSSFLPQVFKAYKTKDTKSLSLTMYVALFIGTVMWMIYGIYLKSLSIILANAITALSTLYLVILIVKHKK